nr:envelope glycoprotein K UL53 [Psittacid alphaherpesvirus 6]
MANYTAGSLIDGSRTAALVAVISIVVALGSYTLFVFVYAAHISRGGACCVYATVPDVDRVDPATNFTWEALNASLIYVPWSSVETVDNADISSLLSLGIHDLSCTEPLLSIAAAAAIEAKTSGRQRLRLVVGARNCSAYLWNCHIRLLLLSIVGYCVFYTLRSCRRMFGVVRFAKDVVSPTRYAWNYAARVLATTIVKRRYCKMAAFMCELSMHRNCANRRFVSDPISYFYYNPLVALIVLTEAVVRIMAQCAALATIGSLTVPCVALYSIAFQALTGAFVAAIILSELVLLLSAGPAETYAAFGESGYRTKSTDKELGGGNTVMPTKAERSAPAVIFTTCCATVLSGLFVKLLHVLFVIGVIVILVRYEQKLQAALFGTAGKAHNVGL